MSIESQYIGNELELFSHAKNWKNYWEKKVVPFLGEHVLEVGAGLGTNTNDLLSLKPSIKNWVCLEPDGELSKEIYSNVDEKYHSKISVETSYLAGYKPNMKFDSILYIDVIEHIEHDASEINLAKTFLKDGGHLIILVPAHNFLFSDFDKAIGHFRRYNKSMLKNAVGNDLKLDKLMYLDSVGMCASMVNKLFLKQSYPTIKQIKFWDNYIVKTSLISDTVFMNKIGKTLLGVWRKVIV